MATQAELAVRPPETDPGGGYLSPRPGRGEVPSPLGPGARGSGAIFKKKPESELMRMSDEELVAYLVAARNAGDFDEMTTALGHFAWRREPMLRNRARAKLDRDEDVEDIVMQTIKDTLEAAFDGTSPGEAVKLMQQILSRRIADFYRERERRPAPEALPEESDDEERKRPDVAISKDDKDVVWAAELIEREFANLSEHHQRVVDLRVFAGLSSKETADEVNREFSNLDTPMTATNVDKIASRFREAMRGELDDG